MTQQMTYEQTDMDIPIFLHFFLCHPPTFLNYQIQQPILMGGF